MSTCMACCKGYSRRFVSGMHVICEDCFGKMGEVSVKPEKVRGCPFCGKKAIKFELNIDKDESGTLMGQVVCDACFSAGPLAAGIDKMLELWNVRGKSGEFYRATGSMDDLDLVKKASPCPFCLNDWGLEYLNLGDQTKVYIISCQVCGSSGPQPINVSRPQSKKEAVYFWNEPSRS